MVSKYRRHLTPIAETLTEVICSLVIRDETNVGFTHGGGVVRFTKPVTQIALDTAVQKIADERDNAYPKKWTEDDEKTITRIAPTRETNRLVDWAVARNKADWPSIGVRRSRG